MKNNTFDIEKYIKGRCNYLNSRVNYQYGYTSREEIIFGLAEMRNLAEMAGLWDLFDTLSARVNTLRECRTAADFALAL